jgi:HEAT repeat protein
MHTATVQRLISGLSAMLQVALLCADLGMMSRAAEVRRSVGGPTKSIPPLEQAQWVWGRAEDSVAHLRRVVVLEEKPASAEILITADNGYELFVNGSRVGGDSGIESTVWQSVERYDVASRLTRGRNVIGIRGLDLGGVRGVVAAVRIEFKKHDPLTFTTDTAWRVAGDGNAVDYSHPEFVEGPDWRDATVVGPMGMAPWGMLAWKKDSGKPRGISGQVEMAKPGKDFRWPEAVAFIGEDCSVYVPERGDAWGVCFRVGDWSRAYTEFDLPCPSKIGRKLYTLRPGAGAKPRLLIDAGSGVLGSPSVSFDGRFLLISMARAGEKFFHVYRVPVSGGKPERLTDGPFHDIDPAELPDGRIVFTSTRVGTFEEYHQPPSRALFVMNATGADIHPITSTLIFDNEPKVMADGRVAFIRTDNFFDRGKVETRLHIIRPDGTDGLPEFGANVGPDYGVRLRAFGYGSPAPLPGGRLAYISNRGNFIGMPGSPEREQHRLPAGLGDLAPLPDGRLLCTVLRPGARHPVTDALGVIDPRDNRVTALFESPNGPIHSPVFLGPRAVPPVIPDYVDRGRADDPGATGFLFCQNARFTTKGKAGWPHVRAIRVLGAMPLTLRSSHSHIVHVGNETVELGTVPLAPDGSFFIEVPADTPLALQAVDAEGRSELNEMSWMYVRPGERRSCLGCHHPREAAPALEARVADALREPPLKLTGQGEPHHFRGNNPGVTGMMDLQFERFRECASINRNQLGSAPLASRRDEIAALIRQLREGGDELKISAAQRLALFRDRDAASALAGALKTGSREARVAAALALAPCGGRETIPPLLGALEDPDAAVARSAVIALENLTGHADTGDDDPVLGERKRQAEHWRNWLAKNPFNVIEADLIRRLRAGTATDAAKREIVVALGHIGGDSAGAALREFITARAVKNPYPVFDRDNRTDTFTFPADSPLNPRTLQEAVRALGSLRDTNALPFLRDILATQIEPRSGNLFLAEAAIEALGRIGGIAAEDTLLATFAALKDYWHYVGWYSDHPALYACHSSPLHARLIEALDELGSTRAAAIVTQLIRSVPTDPDRALFARNDDYELLVGRLIRRSGRGAEVVEACLALLGDPQSHKSAEIANAISVTHPAWGGHPGPENRAAQIISLASRTASDEPRVRAAFDRYRVRPEEPISRVLGNPTWTPIRHWVLFYLARALGNLGDRASVDTLVASLGDELNEARHGRPDPSQPEIHFLHLEYTPCWRAAAAWALGRIGDRRAVPALLGAVRNLDNATDVRHAAARALENMAGPDAAPELAKLAADYPEVSVRRVLLSAREKWGGSLKPTTTVARSNESH